MPTKSAKAHSTKGRPVFKKDDQVRSRLLKAATELFASYEFRAVSIRKIAARAGVNTAMIHYYFGDKAGLYNSMMEQVSLPVEKVLLEIGNRDDLSIEEFVKVWIRTMVTNPWYPIFIIREGIIGEGPVREATAERLREIMAPALTKALENDQKNGRIRAGLDIRMITMSISSLITYPFLVRPLMEKILGISFEEDNLDKLTKHTTEVLLHGIRD